MEIDELTLVLEEIKRVNPDLWVLLTPDGGVHVGTPAQLSVILGDHVGD